MSMGLFPLIYTTTRIPVSETFNYVLGEPPRRTMPRINKPKQVSHKDQDCSKGAVESDPQGNTSLRGQLGHRTQDPLIKSSDSDFPEPGGNPEHSGEPTAPESPQD